MIMFVNLAVILYWGPNKFHQIGFI
ncbi:uncharacterized protein METZ01_LOCUS479244 [marine metagenome]|uniref:Uncharacterized protein n=1 Tax=marine metagenome TaxID=408172 RepID=A0A383C303_9ZZZZ